MVFIGFEGRDVAQNSIPDIRYANCAIIVCKSVNVDCFLDPIHLRHKRLIVASIHVVNDIASFSDCLKFAHSLLIVS